VPQAATECKFKELFDAKGAPKKGKEREGNYEAPQKA
jgi:hypothetical protein